MVHRLPIYRIVLGESEGIKKMSLVDMPAVEKDFLKFDKQKEVMAFSYDEAQHIVLGCALRCNYLIYRRSEQLGEYYVVFDKDSIKELYEKFMRDPNRVNLDHATDTEGVYLIQSFIKDSSKGIAPVGFEDCEDGSWFCAYKVENEEVWKSVKDGTFNGFSVEGVFDLIDTDVIVEEEYNLEKRLMQFVTVDRILYAINHTYYCDMVIDGDAYDLCVVLAYGIDKDGDEAVVFYREGGLFCEKVARIQSIQLQSKIFDVPIGIVDPQLDKYLTRVIARADYKAKESDKPEEDEDVSKLSKVEKIKYAIEHHSYCVIEYKDADGIYTFREVVFYVYGISKYSGRDAVRVYHTMGDTTSGHIPYWRLMLVERINSITIDTTKGGRQYPDRLYRESGDKGMSTIYAQAKF